MTGPPAATAACRVAVRRSLAGHDGPVLAAVSGGADSLALAAALAFERPGSGALVVDHALQPGSASVAETAAAQCRSLGLAAHVLSASPHAAPSPAAHWGSPNASGAAETRVGDPQSSDRGARKEGGGGPEGAARELRYALLEEAASRFDTAELTGAAGTASGRAVVLLGHTRDDQAESVLLGLVRGSGARSLSGMAPVRDRYRRPFLDVPRATVRQACSEAGLAPHEDPHNDDPAFTRVGVRKLLADLDITDGLARSAAMLREDADALDALTTPTAEVAELAAMLPALRARALKRWAEEVSGRALTGVQVLALRGLVEDWHGQGPVALPGGGQVSRVGGRLAFSP
ncbi:MAG: tRNA lysidine(34) synthetase TilS [Actinomycetota bacterium]|nr:tRNA lysidine(34) synthetase TilS [Actinomycetota bacterium]